jgi:hypothetical protein
MNMVDTVSTQNEYRTFKLIERTIRRGLKLKTEKIEEMSKIRL